LQLSQQIDFRGRILSARAFKFLPLAIYARIDYAQSLPSDASPSRAGDQFVALEIRRVKVPP
jgi:hypothetical protein